MDTHETTIYTAILITSLVLATVIAFFFISIIRHQRRNQALYKSKIIAEITTLENERKRTAADLHDELGPILSAVKFQINSFDLMSEEDRQNLEKANRNIDEIISRMRGIANDLMPNTLLRKGLVAALQASVEAINKSNNIDIELVCNNLPELSESRSINLYRILQEVIHNTIRHSKASSLKIELKMENGNLLVLTEDNGIGFNYEGESREQVGLGMRSLLSRTEVLEGSMYVDSKIDKGTKFRFEIPI